MAKQKKSNGHARRVFWPIFVDCILIIVFLVICMHIYQEAMQNHARDSIATITVILSTYNKTQGYYSSGLSYSADSSRSMWILINRTGIKAELCAGNVEENISGLDFYDYVSSMNHAWVIAETFPSSWVAIETTSGYMVWSTRINDSSVARNDLYYIGSCFSDPTSFMEFINTRSGMISACSQASYLETQWNQTYIGTHVSQESTQFKETMDRESQQCSQLTTQLGTLLNY